MKGRSSPPPRAADGRGGWPPLPPAAGRPPRINGRRNALISTETVSLRNILSKKELQWWKTKMLIISFMANVNVDRKENKENRISWYVFNDNSLCYILSRNCVIPFSMIWVNIVTVYCTFQWNPRSSGQNQSWWDRHMLMQYNKIVFTNPEVPKLFFS